MAVTAAAYLYIYFRIKAAIEESGFVLFSSFSFKQFCLTFLSLIMVLPNWLLESIKWKKLLEKTHPLSLTLAIKSVGIGITFAIFTPYRLGEYFGRPTVLPKEKKSKGVLTNIISSISQSIVTYSAGIIGTILLVTSSSSYLFFSNHQTIILLSLLVILASLLFFYFHPAPLIHCLKGFRFFTKYWHSYEFITRFSKRALLVVLIISIFRYLVFFTQYYLLLLAFDVNISFRAAFIAISLSYIFLFSIPGIPVADMGIRGSLALFFLGFYSSNEIGIVMASSTLWIINLAIPAAIGSFFLLQQNKTTN